MSEHAFALACDAGEQAPTRAAIEAATLVSCSCNAAQSRFIYSDDDMVANGRNLGLEFFWELQSPEKVLSP